MKKQTARALRKNLRLEFAAHHFVFHSKSAKDISKVILVSPEKICRWCSTPEWRNALKLWGYGTACPFVTDFYDYAKSSFDSLTERWKILFDGEIPSFSDLSVFDVKKGD